jgi:hypothetical protein
MNDSVEPRYCGALHRLQHAEVYRATQTPYHAVFDVRHVLDRKPWSRHANIADVVQWNTQRQTLVDKIYLGLTSTVCQTTQYGKCDNI